MRHIDNFGGGAFDNCVAEHAGTFAGYFDVQPLLDDVNDLVDDKSHRSALIGEHQYWLRTVRLKIGLSINAQ